MMARMGKAFRVLTASVLVLALAGTLFSYRPYPTQAQQATLNQVTVHALQQVATEGGPAEFSVRRVGGTSSAQTVLVKTWETQHDDPVYGNQTEQVHQVWFPRLSRDVTLRIAVYNDLLVGRTGDLRAEVQTSPDNDYTVGSPSLAAIQVLAYTTDMTNPLVSIERETPQLTEGAQGTQNVQFRVHRTKDTSQDTTVLLRVDDPGNRLRGNHWDPPPELPTEFTVPAGQSWAMLTIPLPDDHWDAATRIEEITLVALPSHDYLLAPGNSPVTSDSADVIDDDDAQELELNFGKDGTNDADADADEGDTLKFTVKRRSTDTDNPARFTVRVETDRSGPDLVLDEWTEDTGTGNLYREYSYELTGTDLEVEQEIEVTQNGEAEDDWSYTAKILPLQDYQGNDLDSATEALYWTVKSGFRETEVEASDSGDSAGTVTLSADVTTVQEGGEVVYTLGRVGGKRAEEITVQVRTWEHNHRGGGNNPTEQFHTVVIPPWEENTTFSVYAYVDEVAEPGADRLRARITSVTGGDYERETADFIAVEINDPPSNSAAVTIAVDNTGITEGQSATFTLTRTGGDTTQPLTVNVRVDDAHGYLRGNHWEAAPEIPTQVEFGANETTKTITLTALDDERDLPGGTFSVTVLPGTGYHPGNTGLATRAAVIPVDNDVPQELTFQWGWIDFGDSDWETGQSYLECNGTCNNGPAEGSWHYTDGRDFDFYNEVETYWPVHFQVSRRSQDKSRTAYFTVRVEHDRGWLSPRHSGWTLDPVTGKHYKDFPLTLTAGQRSVVVRIEVPGQQPGHRLELLRQDSPHDRRQHRRGARLRRGVPVLERIRPTGAGNPGKQRRRLPEDQPAGPDTTPGPRGRPGPVPSPEDRRLRPGPGDRGGQDLGTQPQGARRRQPHRPSSYAHLPGVAADQHVHPQPGHRPDPDHHGDHRTGLRIRGQGHDPGRGGLGEPRGENEPIHAGKQGVDTGRRPGHGHPDSQRNVHNRGRPGHLHPDPHQQHRRGAKRRSDLGRPRRVPGRELPGRRRNPPVHHGLRGRRRHHNPHHNAPGRLAGHTRQHPHPHPGHRAGVHHTGRLVRDRQPGGQRRRPAGEHRLHPAGGGRGHRPGAQHHPHR